MVYVVHIKYKSLSEPFSLNYETVTRFFFILFFNDDFYLFILIYYNLTNENATQNCVKIFTFPYRLQMVDFMFHINGSQKKQHIQRM
jgi:hypothetical protein